MAQSHEGRALVVATSATATATVDGLFAVVAALAVAESKGVEEARSALPVTAGVLGLGAVRLGAEAERLGEVDMIGVSPTMANDGMISEGTTLFWFKNPSFRRRNILSFLRRNYECRYCFDE